MTREEKVKCCNKLVARLRDQQPARHMTSLSGDVLGSLDSDKCWFCLGLSHGGKDWYTMTVPAPYTAEGWQELESRAVRFINGCAPGEQV